jgi:hypothetical protein
MLGKVGLTFGFHSDTNQLELAEQSIYPRFEAKSPSLQKCVCTSDFDICFAYMVFKRFLNTGLIFPINLQKHRIREKELFTYYL